MVQLAAGTLHTLALTDRGQVHHKVPKSTNPSQTQNHPIQSCTMQLSTRNSQTKHKMLNISTAPLLIHRFGFGEGTLRANWDFSSANPANPNPNPANPLAGLGLGGKHGGSIGTWRGGTGECLHTKPASHSRSGDS